MSIWSVDRDRWFLWAPFFFGVGIHLYFSEIVISPYCIVAAILMFCSTIILLRKHVLVYAAIVPLVIALGLVAASYRTHSVEQTYHRLQSPWLGRITAVVQEVDVMEGQYRLILSDIHRGPPEIKRVRVNFRFSKESVPEIMETLKPGDRIRAYVHLYSPPPQETALNYDFEFWAFFQKIEAVGFGSAKSVVVQSRQEKGSWFESLRYQIATQIRAEKLGQVGEIAAALITGYRNGVSNNIRDDFAGSGLAHLLAISGLHLSLIAGLMFFVFRRLLSLSEYCALHWPLKKIAAGFALICSFFYLKISGESLPTLRAFIMISFIMVAIILDREAISLRSVAWAALFVLGAKPESLYSPSFQMSFAAVTALIGVYEYFRMHQVGGGGVESKKGKVLKYLGGSVLSSLIASIATLPFIIHTFHRFSWHSIEANLIAIPLMTFWIMPCAVLVVLLMPVNLHSLPLSIMEIGIDGLIHMASMVNAWPGSFIPVGVRHEWFVGLILLGSLWLLIWTHRWRWVGILPITVATFLPGKDVFMLVDQSREKVGVLSGKHVLLTPSGRASFVAQDWRGIVGASEIKKLSKHIKDSTGTPGKGQIFPFDDRSILISVNQEQNTADIVIEGISKIKNIRLASGEELAGGSALWRDAHGKIRRIVPVRSKMPWRSYVGK